MQTQDPSLRKPSVEEIVDRSESNTQNTTIITSTATVSSIVEVATDPSAEVSHLSSLRVRTQPSSSKKRKSQEIQEETQSNTSIATQTLSLPAVKENEVTSNFSINHNQEISNTVDNQTAYTDTQNSIPLSSAPIEQSENSVTEDRSLNTINAHIQRFRLQKDHNPELKNPKMNTVLEKKVYINDKSSKIERKKPDYSSSDMNRNSLASGKSYVKEDYSKKYLSNPTCTSCHKKLITWAEARFHTQSHRSQKCHICSKQIDEDSIEKHVYTCLLLSGTLTKKELLAYMKVCTVDLVATVKTSTELSRTVVKKRAKQAPKNGSTGRRKKLAAKETPQISVNLSSKAKRTNNNVYKIAEKRKGKANALTTGKDGSFIKQLKFRFNLILLVDSFLDILELLNSILFYFIFFFLLN